MPIPLGVLAVAGAGGGGGGGVANAFELLETQILSSNTTNIEFTNLGTAYGSTYKHLQLRIVTRAANSTRSDNVYMQFNGDTTGYAYHFIYGESGVVPSGGGGNQTNMIVTRYTGSQSPADVFGLGIVDILDWNSSNKNTTVRALTAATDGTNNTVWLFSGLWVDTSAVTSIKLYGGAGDFVTNSRFSLYGLKG